MGLKPGQDPGALMRAVGEPLFSELEYNTDKRRIDHVRIALMIGGPGRFIAAVNTLSIRNRDAGFDSRIRVGVVRSTYDELPALGLFRTEGLDYARIESENNVFYEHHDQAAMERLITGKTAAASLVEVWGEIYRNRRPGIHQIHCRRASCAVPEDLASHDGALKFYFAREKHCEMFLFKFCGQP